MHKYEFPLKENNDTAFGIIWTEIKYDITESNLYILSVQAGKRQRA